MPRIVASPLPSEAKSRLESLGSRIRNARLHRKLRQIDLAERAGVSRSTLEAIERGSAETSIGAFLRVLWAMGLDREIDVIADPAIDREGAALEYKPGERRVQVRRSLDNAF